MKIGEILSGLPVPPVWRGVKEGKWTNRFKKMKIGDYFEIDCENHKERRHMAQLARFGANRYRQRHEPGFQYAVRVDPEDKDKLRFWRLG